jgi:hypothetical protein
LLGYAVVLAACSGSEGRYQNHPEVAFAALNNELKTPQCQEARPLPKLRAGQRQHVCWEYGKPTDRALSASCRINERGEVKCWREMLKGAPHGDFRSIDDNGYNACALDVHGLVSCWGNARRGWNSTPTESFVSISVGDTSPVHMGHAFACGLTASGQVICWEEGQGSPFSFPGVYGMIEAGDTTVCGLTHEGVMNCMQSAQVFRERTAPSGLFTELALGAGARCVLDASHRAQCWTSKYLADPPVVLENVRAIRAGREHACMLNVAGTIKCLGDARPPPDLRATFLSRPSGSDNYCAISVDSKRYCWGDPDPAR